MVFCGRPSRACANCRTRRIKCDQCLTAKKLYPRYRDQPPGSKNGYRVLVPTSLSDAPRLAATSMAEEEGLNFLLKQYSLVRTPQHDQSYHMLHCAMAPVGMAGLSNVKNDENLMILARRKYHSALRLAMVSLQNSVEVGEQKLCAVILLGLFELLGASHFDGAAAVLKAIRCIQRHKCLPRAMIEYPESCRVFHSKVEQPACSLAGIVVRFVALLRASVGHRSFTDPAIIIRYALDLENELKTRLCSYRRVGVGEDLIRGMEHVYPNRFIANSWSWYRTVRILVNDLLVEHIPSHVCVAVDRDMQLVDFFFPLSQLTTEICESAAYFLDYFHTHRGTSGGSSEAMYLWVLGTFKRSLEIADQVTQDRQRIVFPVHQ
ncbi:hypothetical protein V1505DRAFT_402813 [Lipomyces doorenjongii]